MEHLLRAHELSCERGGLLLFEKLHIEVRKGDLLQLIGPNGCGKTTLLRILAGLSQPLTGKISRDADLVYQGHRAALKASMTALENLQWYFPDRSDDEICRALASWRLGGYEEVRCGQLSAGQQQKVTLSRLLLSSAPLWLLDEPFTSLDQASTMQLEKCLVDHVEQGGAVLFTSHVSFSHSSRLRSLELQAYAPMAAGMA